MPHRAKLPMASPGPGNTPAIEAAWAARTSDGEPGGQPAGQAQDVGEDGGGDERRAHRRGRHGDAGGPGLARAGQAAGGELPGDGPGERAAERHRAQALDDGAGEHVAAGDRGEEEVAHVGRFDGDRPAVAAAAQPEGEGEGEPGADHGGTVLEQVGDLLGRRRLVGHEAAQPQHDAAADERREVHAIGDLEPLQRAQPPSTPRAPHLLDDAA